MAKPPTKAEIQAENDKLKKQLAEAAKEINDLEEAVETREETIEQLREEANQMNHTFLGAVSAQPPGEMKAYTKYSYFVEKKMGLGRNGKRLLHGGVTAGATYGVGKYLGTEAIVDNPLASMAVAAGVGIVGTAILDATVMDKQEMLKMRLAELDEMTKKEQVELVQAAVAAKAAS
jgi:hypothetical protein